MGADMIKRGLISRIGLGFSGNHQQPPLVLPRRGDAGYSESVKDWEMQVTPVLSKTGRCRLLWLMDKLLKGHKDLYIG